MMVQRAAPVSIALRKCRKTFPDGTRALESLDLTIEAGETIVLLGPSGCGKTTTLRMIAGLEQPDEGGQVLFDGVDVTAQPIEKRNIGMVFQSYALFPNMSVAGNIGYGLRIRGKSKAESNARVSEMLDLMRISKLAERRIDQLSGGQRQRVALAGLWLSSHAPCCSTSRSRHWTPNFGRSCGSRSTSCSAGSASRQSTSRTIRRRPWRWVIVLSS